MSARRRRLRWVAVLAAVLVAGGAAVGIRSLWHVAKSTFFAAGCTVGSYSLDTSQAAVASTMVGVVTERNLPSRAAVLVLAAGLQESKLRNLASGAGDRDSVGVLQQRPSQGWGSVSQLNDVHYATGAFLDALVKVDGWQTLPLAEAVQDVQNSADGSAYAQHENEATALTRALNGTTPAGITCQFEKPTVVADPATVAAQLTRDLPVNPPVVGTIGVTVPGARWQTAAWLVANADRLGVDRVAYDKQAWTRAKGWRPDATAPTTGVEATLYRL